MNYVPVRDYNTLWTCQQTGLINAWQDDIFSRKYIVWHMVSCLNLYYWYQSHHLTNMLDDNML